MIKLVRVHRTDHQDVIGNRAEVRYDIAEFHPGLTVFFEGSLGSHQGGGGRLDEGEAGFFEQAFGEPLSGHFVELGLRVEEIELGGSSSHEDENTSLGFGVEMGFAGKQRILERISVAGSEQSILREHGSQGHPAQSRSRGGKEIATVQMMVFERAHSLR